MSMDDDVQRGDFVTYERYFFDGIGTGMETGSGYLDRIDDDKFVVHTGNRLVEIPFDKGTVNLRAKQFRMEV